MSERVFSKVYMAKSNPVRAQYWDGSYSQLVEIRKFINGLGPVYNVSLDIGSGEAMITQSEFDRSKNKNFPMTKDSWVVIDGGILILTDERFKKHYVSVAMEWEKNDRVSE